MPKFKINDVIIPIERNRGFEQARITGIFIDTDKKSKFKGRTMYKLKIPCGIAIIPVEAEEFYKLADKSTIIRV